MHLDYLYLQILSTVSLSQLQSIFSKRSNFDLRRLLEGTDGVMNSLISRLQWDFEGLTGTLKVLTLNEDLRSDCATALKPLAKHQDVLYALLLHHSTIVTLLRPKSHSIHPSDLHILLNTISSSKSLRAPNSESWLPICLPRFNSKGFVYAYISFFESDRAKKVENEDEADLKDEEEAGLGIILITSDREGFFDMRTWKETILEVYTYIYLVLSDQDCTTYTECFAHLPL